MGKSALREAEEVEALRAGIELGMSVVDTAEMYGNEELVGTAIRGLPFPPTPRPEPRPPANGA